MRILQLLRIVAVVGVSVPVGLAQDASSFKTLYSFTGGPDGGEPVASLVIGSGGVLYGTTYSGGTSNLGTVFSLTPPTSPGGVWTETVLHDFTGGTDGANPQSGVVTGSGGVLFGTTSGGGASNAGTVFQVVPPTTPGGAWTATVLYTFNGRDEGGYPHAGLAIGKGVLFGTTLGKPGSRATVFSLKPPASPSEPWTETVLHSFISPMVTIRLARPQVW